MKDNKNLNITPKGYETLHPKMQCSNNHNSYSKMYTEVFDKIEDLSKENRILKVAIDGNSGAGKSTLAKDLKRKYDCNIFHMDDFFLRPWQRTEDRLKESGGNVDYLRFKEEVMVSIDHGQEFQYRPYDCKTQDFKDYIKVEPRRLNIIEGVYSMHPTLLPYYDLKIFLKVDPKEQSRRILKRDGPFMHKKFLGEWIPLEDIYFKKLNIQQKSDVVIHLG